MFADPQTVTYATVAKSLPAISRSDVASGYKLYDTGNVIYDLLLSHSYKSRNRVVARLSRSLYTQDPLIPANFSLTGATATLTLDFPSTGLAPADVQNLGKALVGWASDANLLKLIGGET